MTEKSGEDPGVDATLARPGGLSYMEIPAVDVVKSSLFYENVLGWKIERGDDGGQKFADRTGHLIGRWSTGREASRERGVLPYFYIEEINRVVEKVKIYGGEMVKAPFREGNLWVAIVADPAGNMIGLWQEGFAG